MNIVKPHRLKSGDFIGVVAPAYPFPNPEDTEYFGEYLKGRKELESMGFQIIEGKNIHKRQWWRAGTPQERAEDINDMYRKSEVKAIIAHDGANDCISVLEYLDYDLISVNPKPFIGFSNITNIHSALFAKNKMIGFHMGLLTYELGKYWQNADPKLKELGKKYFYDILTSVSPLGEIEKLSGWENWKPGVFEGILFGGNLSSLDSLIGTPYFPDLEMLKGAILFWELDNSPSYRIERVLTHLKYTGVLEVISGMVIGKLVDMKPSANEIVEPSLKEVITNVLKDYSFPILANVDFGHQMVQIPMPIGIKVKVDTNILKMEFLESAVS